MKKLLNYSIYDTKKFIKYFCELNSDFIKGTQNCSQTFIRTLIGNINKECIDNNCGIILNNIQYINVDNGEYKKIYRIK